MNQPTEVNLMDLLEVVKTQRNAWADEASVLAAQCATLDRRAKALEKELADLKAAAAPKEATA